jgi:hypothetical protein
MYHQGNSHNAIFDKKKETKWNMERLASTINATPLASCLNISWM